MFLKELIVGLLLILIFGIHKANAEDVPMLRIETGRHLGKLTDIASAKEGRIFVTSSEDKTIRIWDASGRQLKVIRPPISDGHIGKVVSVAISPDASTVAYSFFTKYFNEETKQEFEIFRTHINHWQTDTLIKSSIKGREFAPVKLSFSSDGKFLAKYGADIQIYRTSDWTRFARTSFFDDYIKLYGGGDKVWNSLQFFPKENRFAAIRDKKIYFFSIKTGDYSKPTKISNSTESVVDALFADNKRLVLDKIEKKLNGRDPASLSISPNGINIAISYFDTANLTILDNKGTKLELNSSDLKPAYFNSLPSMFATWSLDGKNLFAGGFTSKNGLGGAIVIRKWALSPHTSYKDIDTSQEYIRHPVFKLVPLESGVAFTSDNLFGIVDLNEAQLSVRILNPLGMYTQGSPYASVDGSKIGFSYLESGDVIGDKYTYDIPSRSLIPVKTLFATDLFDKIDGFYEKVPGLEAMGQLSDKPELNGVLLDVDSRPLSYSFSAGRNSLLLGTSWFLYQFNSTGKLVWRVTSPEKVTGLNVTRDGRFIIAAIGDGTIRWYRFSDGAEQLAFFPHSDRKRWVLWTPSGYYDAAPGAEDLIGWHLNRGEDNPPDFFPASRFRNQFNRPDVISKVLESGSEAEAVEIANAEAGRKPHMVSLVQALPPVVEIASPNEGATVSTASITLKYSTRAPNDAPVIGLRARVNGLAVSLPEMRNLVIAATSGTREITLPIPPQDSEIQLFAENKNGVSTPATLRVTWAGKKVAADEDSRFKPKLYVLAVGISKYQNPDYNLGLAAKDATDFAAVLKKQKGKLYGDVVVRLLTDDKASKDEVLDGLEWLKREVTSRDVGVMFLAGHGINDNIGNYYFLPYNADPDKLLRTGVAQNDIKLTLNSLAGKAVFFVDTCHSGNALGTSKTRAIGSRTDALVNELASAENGVIVFSSSTGRQLSQEDPAWGNGAFTKAVVEGLSGKAEIGNSGKITHKGLDYYVTDRVKALTNGQQSPVSIAPGGVTDFPIALVGK